MIIKRTITIDWQRGAAAFAVILGLGVCVSGSALRPVKTGKSGPQAVAKSEETPGIVWESATRVCIERGATYGRIARLSNGDLLCAYEKAGKAWAARSKDDGKTWGEKQVVRELPYANAANAELLVLRGGRILYLYNQRPHDKKHPFAIGVCVSDNHGLTWRAQTKNVYDAGTEPGRGCWEPAALQLPSGEIQLFFANEFPYPENDDQEITRLRSRDEGKTWSKPEIVSLRAGHRDGMPVPLVLQNQSDITLAIEDNGLKPGNMLQPAVLKVSPEKNAPFVSGGDTARRWEAISPPLGARVYAGAPYLAQMPSGETVLSCQSNEGGRKEAQMAVYVGDKTAHHFGRKSIPFPAPENVSGSWNALFVKNARTLSAISDTTVDGVRGLWAIDGRIAK